MLIPPRMSWGRDTVLLEERFCGDFKSPATWNVSRESARRRGSIFSTDFHNSLEIHENPSTGSPFDRLAQKGECIDMKLIDAFRYLTWPRLKTG